MESSRIRTPQVNTMPSISQPTAKQSQLLVLSRKERRGVPLARKKKGEKGQETNRRIKPVEARKAGRQASGIPRVERTGVGDCSLLYYSLSLPYTQRALVSISG